MRRHPNGRTDDLEGWDDRPIATRERALNAGPLRQGLMVVLVGRLPVAHRVTSR